MCRILLMICIVFVVSCHNGVNNKEENLPTPVKPTIPDEKDNFVEITPPKAGIIGSNATYKMPSDEFFYKGVFIEGRNVKLSPYLIHKYEVTYKLWKVVYDEAIKKGYKFMYAGQEGSEGTKGAPATENNMQPVVHISFRDCIVWCNAYTELLNGSDVECVYRKPGDKTTVIKDATENVNKEYPVDEVFWDTSKKGFRLPTEAEWEFAARFQGDGSKEEDKINSTKHGDIYLTNLNSSSGAIADWENNEAVFSVAWCKDNAEEKTHFIKQKKPNYLGLYDMSGNVWEWCFDWYDPEGLLSMGEVENPQGAEHATKRSGRGGSWTSNPKGCSVGSRGAWYTFNISLGIGFRLAKTL